ncbi:hypothetical protein FALBO_3419 [Fusarium albosuccineum]|uniref:Uncharacterized protein n=1 Tax=Fusarium albosuccineum TaxID=1237068 RepID=A0A8H4PH70_9HYPO|nr:hypothetical protein FALBO_3419 [Fusarium albosuccineum]
MFPDHTSSAYPLAYGTNEPAKLPSAYTQDDVQALRIGGETSWLELDQSITKRPVANLSRNTPDFAISSARSEWRSMFQTGLVCPLLIY